MFDVDGNQWSETNHLIFKNESYIHQHISSTYKWNNCNGYGKVFHEKVLKEKYYQNINIFPSGTNIHWQYDLILNHKNSLIVKWHKLVKKSI